MSRYLSRSIGIPTLILMASAAFASRSVVVTTPTQGMAAHCAVAVQATAEKEATDGFVGMYLYVYDSTGTPIGNPTWMPLTNATSTSATGTTSINTHLQPDGNCTIKAVLYLNVPSGLPLPPTTEICVESALRGFTIDNHWYKNPDGLTTATVNCGSTAKAGLSFNVVSGHNIALKRYCCCSYAGTTMNCEGTHGTSYPGCGSISCPGSGPTAWQNLRLDWSGTFYTNYLLGSVDGSYTAYAHTYVGDPSTRLAIQEKTFTVSL